jgi:hypothetical protein
MNPIFFRKFLLILPLNSSFARICIRALGHDIRYYIRSIAFSSSPLCTTASIGPIRDCLRIFVRDVLAIQTWCSPIFSFSRLWLYHWRPLQAHFLSSTISLRIKWRK